MRRPASTRRCPVAPWLAWSFLLGLGAGLHAEPEGLVPPRPVLFLAHKRGQAALFRLITARYPFHYVCAQSVPADSLRSWQMIVVCDGGEITDATAESLNTYLQDGGCLVLPGSNAQPYLGILRGAFGPSAQLAQASLPGFLCRQHPLLAGEVRDPDTDLEDEMADGDAPNGKPKETRENAWSATLFGTVLVKPEGGQSLVYLDDTAAIWLKAIGKGRVLFLADGVFPRSGPKSPVNVLPGYDAFLVNLFRFLGAPTLEQAARFYGRSVVWYREPQLEGARTHSPPFPVSDREMVQALQLCAGRNEHERTVFYTTVPFLPEQTRVCLEDFTGGDGRIPPEYLKLGIQGRLHKDYRGPLVYIRWLGNGETTDLASPVTTWWLDIFTRGLAAGTYRGGIRIDMGAQQFRVPVELRVDESAIPVRRPYAYDAEFFCENVPPAGALDSWQELGLDFLVGGRAGGADPPVRATGEPLSQFARKSAEPLMDRIPPLDLSASPGWRFDILIQELLHRGITRFRTYGFFGIVPDALLPLARDLFRKDTLDPGSPEHRQTLVAYMREVRRYLRERGYVHAYTKHMDEWLGNSLDEYLDVAVPLADAGWRNVANPNPRSPLANRAQRRRIWPYIHIYWMEDEPQFWYDLQDIRPLLPGTPPSQEFHGVYTSSVWWYLGHLTGPSMAWAAAYRGYSGLHQHGWNRWTYEAYNAIHLPDKGLYCPSMGILMMAEGIEEAQYGHVLRSMIAHLRSRPGGEARANELEAKWHKIVSESADAILPVVQDHIQKPRMSRADFSAAKLAVLALLADARNAVRAAGVTPGLRWDNFVFLAGGLPRATILHDEPSAAAAAGLAAQIRTETGVRLPVQPLPTSPAAWPAIQESVVLVSANGNPLYPGICQHLKGIVNDRYPADGAYVLHLDPPSRLWIIGRDQDAVVRGAANLTRVSDLIPFWFEPGLTPVIEEERKP